MEGAKVWLPASWKQASFAQPDYAGEFETIWSRYPLKVGKAAALKAFAARRRAGVPARLLYDATVLYAEQRRGEDEKFTMRGATFYGPNDRWREPFEAKQAKGAGRPPSRDLTQVRLPGEVGAEEVAGDPLADL